MTLSVYMIYTYPMILELPPLVGATEVVKQASIIIN